jgi:aspartate/glutamate racemase
MHIGLIGGIGPAATEYYDRGLIERAPPRPVQAPAGKSPIGTAR